MIESDRQGPEAQDPPDAEAVRHRVFIALWPDDAVRDRLDALARNLTDPGRPVPRAHLHLTLAFAGVLSTVQAECLGKQLPVLSCAPIPLVLDQLGYFARPKVRWIGPTEWPSALDDLAREARALCRECGVRLDAQPFHPHVTLRRFAPSPAESTPFTSIGWTARRIVLVESGRNGRPGRYWILAEATLNGPGTPMLAGRKIR